MTTRIWIVFALLLSGCVGTDVGNPPGDDERRALLEFATVDDDVTAAALASDSFRIDAAWLSVAAVRVQPDCSGTPVRFEGPFYVDLLGAEVLPREIELQGDFGEICRLHIDLGPGGEDAPEDLVGRSAFVVAEGPEGSVTIASSAERILPYAGRGFEFRDGARFVDAFDPAEWFTTPGQGEAGRENVFLGALKKDSRIVIDADGDGEVSRDEYTEPVALPAP